MRSSHPVKKSLSVLLVLAMLCSILTLLPITASASASVDLKAGTKGNPLFIDNADELKALPTTLQTLSNAKENANLLTFYVEMTNHIDLEGATWTPLDLGSYTVHFEGGNHVISNFKTTSGLFSAFGENSTVQNLAVVGATVSCSSGAAGAIVATATDGFSLVNCSTDETTTVTNTSSSPVGGLVGQTTNGTSNNNIYLTDCTNYATVKGNGGSIGGIIGQISNNYSFLLIDTCENHGSISGGKHSGGLVGSADGILQLRLNECVNTADVTTTVSGGYAGGLVGHATCYTASTETWTVKRSKNTGNVTAPSFVGGIIGYAEGAPAYRVSYTGNTGDVTATTTSSGLGAVGGILGYQGASNYDRTLSFTNCYNEGKLTMKGKGSWGFTSSKTVGTGGIVGVLDAKGCSTVTISKCYDLGERDVVSNTYNKNGIIAGNLVNGSTMNVTDCKGISRTNATAIVGSGNGTTTGSTTISSKADIASTLESLERSIMLRRPKGDGSKLNPYLIGTAMELQYFATQLSYDNITYAELTDDIDFGGYSINIDLLDNVSYVPRAIHFDGNGHTIFNYTSKTGIFERIGSGSVIMDLHVSNATISNHNGNNRHAGAIVGQAWQNFTMLGCSADETVSVTQNSTGHVVGGLCGSIEQPGNGLILFVDCVNRANVTGTIDVGGILSTVYSTDSELVFMNCENYGTVSTSSTSAPAGGILGYAKVVGSVSLYNCINNGAVGSSTTAKAGGLIGYAEPRMTGTLLLQNCKNTASITGKTAGALVGVGSATAGDEDKVWSIVGCTNSGSPSALTPSLTNITVSQKDADLSDILTHSENTDLSIRMKLTDHFGLMAITEISNDGAAQNLTNYTDYGFYFLENDERVSPATLMADGTKIAGKAFNGSSTVFMSAYIDMLVANLDRNLHFMAYAVDKSGNETLGAIRTIDVADMILDLTDGYVGTTFVTANKQEIELYRSMLRYNDAFDSYENINLNIGVYNLGQNSQDKETVTGDYWYTNNATSIVEKNLDAFANIMYALDLDVMGLNECDVYRGSSTSFGGYHTPWEIAQRMEDLTGERYYWAFATGLNEQAVASWGTVRPFYNRYEEAGATEGNRPDGLYYSGDGKLPSDGYADHSGFGEGLVSKYPIVAVEERHIDVAKYLTVPTDSTSDADKAIYEYFKNYNADYLYDANNGYQRCVMLIATLNVEGQLVTVIVTHWDYKSYTFDYVDSNGETQTITGNEFPRVASEKAAADALADYADRPTFLMGDLNVTRHSSYIRNLDKVATRAGNDNMTGTFPGSGEKIDHIYYNEHAKVVSYTVETKIEASDHFPVHIRARIQK